MSGVEIKVELDTGATMGFERDLRHMASGSPQRALQELDKGYKMIRDWLLSQMPPDMAKPQAARPPEPEQRGQEIARESIEDDLRTRRGWRL